MARGPSPAELPPDEVIQEILLRLLPHPALFLRASLVCKLWRRLLREPDFTRRFRARHRHAPPLLGFFAPDSSFTPVGDPPDRVTVPRHHTNDNFQVLGCRHGRVLIRCVLNRQLVISYPNIRYGVVFPVAGIPPEPLNYDSDLGDFRGSLICIHGHESNGEDDPCNSRPFRVALLLYCSGRIHAGVYPSRAWLHGVALASLEAPHDLLSSIKPGVLVGNAMYWLSTRKSKIVVFHLGMNQLHLIDGLPTDSLGPYDYYRVVKGKGEEEPDMAAVRGSRLHLYALNSVEGADKWSQYRAVDLGTLPGLSPPVKAIEVTDEAVNTIFLEATNGVFALQLETVEVNKVLSGVVLPAVIAYRSFDVTGSSGRDDGGNEVAKPYSKLFF